MTSRFLSLVAWALCLPALFAKGAGAETDRVQAAAIPTIGIYNCYTGLPAEAIPFCRACGYNTYQRWDLGWGQWPTHLDQYYADMVRDVRRMRKAGFKVFVVLTINMIQRRAGEPEGYAESLFDPADETLMRNRLGYIAQAVRKLKRADGFTIFAGDPGGHGRANARAVF